MPRPHIHLLLPTNQWTKPGFSWCLRFFDATRGRTMPVTDILAHATCPRCLALFGAAKADQKHPMREYSQLDTSQKAVRMDNPASVARYCRHLVHETQEVTMCLMLNTRQRLVHTQELYKGILEESLWHPRDIFGAVLRQHAYGFILVKNHACGESEPTEAERKTTQQLIQCSKLMKIHFLDHVIVARQGFYSLREHTNLWDEVKTLL